MLRLTTDVVIDGRDHILVHLLTMSCLVVYETIACRLEWLRISWNL